MKINKTIDKITALAIREDVGSQDITTNVLVPKKDTAQAFFVTRERAVICGLNLVQAVFKKLDPNVKCRFFCKDGDMVNANKRIIWIEGKTRSLLTGERVALNFLCRLSGIATATRHFVQAVRPYKTKIMDTRKTTPGLRILEKLAVACGDGINHRLNLSEMVLIKDNHRTVCLSKISIPEMIQRAKKMSNKPVAVEVDDLKEFEQALEAEPDIILLDNMTPTQIRKAVKLARKLKPGKRAALEVSGNVNLRNVRAIAKTGVDRISVGSLTHSSRSVDISMDIII
ncbi:MAG TPA: carboxylating nicotinate-nucleotide diphosphorylase [Candidatus Omnitrophota bacterium]|nr:carboxylating nicotinate-nucleotide diphosphorylase [Candidatus Omnitrophota bacterium]HPD85221.1 carboxylating nicotinate-nucleotide diphosphorylase [Candidatus Omnitrophota bacterium]HRZ04278.1 carboxylating nicotinate-nucleotide diphosphorylase [Candidatus Omnitrophota bacterium]